jgi:tRNA threonylcarbamoyladenosine biosynthesis protein TsaB
MSKAQQAQKILAIDTATRIQSLALLDGDKLLEHAQRRVQFNHGSTLLEHVSTMLEEHRLEVGELDLIAVGIGPGSFTGLRVGLAISKALARAESIPLVGVSSLAALAHPVAMANRAAIVCPVYDARRQEVFAGLYRHGAPILEQLEDDQTIAPTALRDKILELSADETVTLVGDGPRRYDELDDWDDADVHILSGWADGPSAASVGLLGRQKVLADGADDLATLQPNYIRPTDAELNT